MTPSVTASAVARRAVLLLFVAVAGVLTGRLVTSLWLDGSAGEGRPVVSSAGDPRGDAVSGGTMTEPSEPTESTEPTEPRCTTALAVLRAWDVRRAAAYSRGDQQALDRLYVPGSAVQAADRERLSAYAERGLVVRGMRMQVLECRALSTTSKRLVVQVTDRLVGAEAVGEGVRRALPRDAPSIRELVLVRREGAWKLQSVRDA